MATSLSVPDNHQEVENGISWEARKDDDDDEGGHHSLPPPVESPLRNEHRNDGTSRRHILKTIAGVAGNVLEWYDFAIFGYFADIIGDVFFPPQPGYAAIAESFAVFGGAFLMRPLGGIMTGYVGDVHGRKKALVMSMMLMAFPTFAMGCLPSYDRIGSFSVVLLTLVRLLQGLSVGGQLMSSLVFTVESHPKKHWGLYGAYVMCAANCGTLLGGLVSFAIRQNLEYDQLRTWGWRIPFLAGILIAIPALYLKFYEDDDDHNGHDEQQQQEQHSSQEAQEVGGGGGFAAHHHRQTGGTYHANPIRASFSRSNIRPLLSATLVPMLWSAGFYLSFVWMAIYMQSLIQPPIRDAFAINSTSLFLSVVLIFPLAGAISDKCGRLPIMLIGGVGVVICGPITVHIIALGNPIGAFLAQTILGLFLCCWGGPMMAWLVESFPPQYRLTAVSIGYDMAHATVGATSPLIATLLVDHVGESAPGMLYTFIGLLSLVGLGCAPRRRQGNDDPASASPGGAMIRAIPTDTDDDEQEGDDDEVIIRHGDALTPVTTGLTILPIQDKEIT